MLRSAARVLSLTRSTPALPVSTAAVTCSATSSWGVLLPSRFFSAKKRKGTENRKRQGKAKTSKEKRTLQTKTKKQHLAPGLVAVRPLTNGQRNYIKRDREHLWKGKPIKSLTVALRKKAGRNNHGRITVRHRGGGHRRRYRLVDFDRAVLDEPGVVQRLEYDPNRSADIALVSYGDGLVSYILAPDDVKPGDTVLASREQRLDVRPGNAMPLGLMPVGTIVHNVELKPGQGGQLARSAGTSAQLLVKDYMDKYALIRLSSKEQRLVLMDCMATVGTVGNAVHRHTTIGKAGRARWLGRRPKVRGVAMNPVDHPMGGGEGKTSGGGPSRSPWGKLSKGQPTVRKPSRMILVRRGGERRNPHSIARS